jgi:hypothetical protein
MHGKSSCESAWLGLLQTGGRQVTDSRDEHETYAHTESPIIDALQNQIARLTAERDEARQEACCLLSSTCDLEAAIPVNTIVHSTGPSPEHFARIRGWDCFQDIAIDSEDGAP